MLGDMTGNTDLQTKVMVDAYVDYWYETIGSDGSRSRDGAPGSASSGNRAIDDARHSMKVWRWQKHVCARAPACAVCVVENVSKTAGVS